MLNAPLHLAPWNSFSERPPDVSPGGGNNIRIVEEWRNILVCLECAWGQITEKTLYAMSRHLGFTLEGMGNEWRP